MGEAAEEFLAAYNRIDRYLRKVSRAGPGRPYAEVVREASRLLAVVSRFESDLLEYGELRNAIVHGRAKPEYVIAEPHPDVVRKIQWLDGQLSSPPMVIPRFRREVKQLTPTDPLSKALTWAKDLQLSQFPVYDDRVFAGLLTGRCIAQWLASSIKDDLVSVGDTTVGEVLAHDETEGHNVLFISAHDTLYDAVRLFSKGPQRSQPVLEALLITHDGKPSQGLLGIITPWDLLELPEGKDF